MGKLIDVDEIKKMYPIMENDFGMVVNERLHKNLDKIPPVEAIQKADMIDILDKIKADIDAESAKSLKYPNWERAKALEWALEIIDKYKMESEEKENG